MGIYILNFSPVMAPTVTINRMPFYSFPQGIIPGELKIVKWGGHYPTGNKILINLYFHLYYYYRVCFNENNSGLTGN